MISYNYKVTCTQILFLNVHRMSSTIITFEPGTLRGPSDPLVTFEQNNITHQDELMILIFTQNR